MFIIICLARRYLSPSLPLLRYFYSNSTTAYHWAISLPTLYRTLEPKHLETITMSTQTPNQQATRRIIYVFLRQGIPQTDEEKFTLDGHPKHPELWLRLEEETVNSGIFKTDKQDLRNQSRYGVEIFGTMPTVKGQTPYTSFGFDEYGTISRRGLIPQTR